MTPGLVECANAHRNDSMEGCSKPATRFYRTETAGHVFFKAVCNSCDPVYVGGYSPISYEEWVAQVLEP